MISTEKFRPGNYDFARRFIQTAVVVDDEAYMEATRSDRPKKKAKDPNRHTIAASASRQSDIGSIDHEEDHRLNANFVMDSFSKLGIICGVVGPKDSEVEKKKTMETMRQADIVVLDWLLQNRKPEYTLELLTDLLTETVDRNSLRLVAIYTGEADLATIYETIFEKLEKAELAPKRNGTETTIPYRHGRLVIYAKSNVKLARPVEGRSVAEEDLPEKLVADFAEMTNGLLPNIALTALTAVREGEHKVLDQFCADLDPAFLAHRACLSNPDDAERQIVNHVAEDLRGLMDSAVAEQSPSGTKAVEEWIQQKGKSFNFAKQYIDKKNQIKAELDMKQTIQLVTEGFEKSALKNKPFNKLSLSAGFACHEVVGLDEKLAWLMSFRTVYNEPPPILWLGSVVTEVADNGEEANHLICMRPRCDCVRLKDETSFLFLPLVEPIKSNEQLVVKIDTEFQRLSIALDSAGWVIQQFKPSGDTRAVTATPLESGRGFEFTYADKKRYIWRGELKDEYAQRIAQTLATYLSRVAVDESEWLRRIKRTGEK